MASEVPPAKLKETLQKKAWQTLVLKHELSNYSGFVVEVTQKQQRTSADG